MVEENEFDLKLTTKHPVMPHKINMHTIIQYIYIINWHSRISINREPSLKMHDISKALRLTVGKFIKVDYIFTNLIRINRLL